MTTNLGFGGMQNPYLQQQVDASLADTVRAVNLTAQPAFSSAMVRSGSFGNSGVQQMNMEAQNQLQQNLGRQANDMRSNNFWQGQNFGMQQDQFNKNFGLANEAFDKPIYDTTFQQGRQMFGDAMGALALQNQIGVQNLGLGTQIQNTPLNYYTGFLNAANSAGGQGGTSSGTSSASGSPLMGALGGWQLGSAFQRQSGGFGSGGLGVPGFSAVGTYG